MSEQPISADLGRAVPPQKDIPAPTDPWWMDEAIEPEIKLGNRLGGGGVGKIYKVSASAPGQENVELAIKIPAEEWSTELIEKEADFLKQLRAKQQQLFPGSHPHFLRTRVISFNEKPAFLMEFVPGEVVGYLRHDGYFKNHPHRAQSALRQYLETLVVLHSLGKTQKDRKPMDIFYTPEGDRLVVLDWDIPKDGTFTRVKFDVNTGFQCFLQNWDEENYPPEVYGKLTRLWQRTLKPEDGTTSQQALELVGKIFQGTATDEEIDTPITTIESLEFAEVVQEERKSREALESIENPDAKEAWKLLIDGFLEKAISRFEPLPQDNRFVRVGTFLTRLRLFFIDRRKQGDNDFWKRYPSEQRKQLMQDVIRVLAEGESVDGKIFKRAKESLQEISRDPTTEEYFLPDHEIPNELRALLI